MAAHPNPNSSTPPNTNRGNTPKSDNKAYTPTKSTPTGPDVEKAKKREV